MFAVIETGGKQYRVAPGEVIRVEKLAGAAGDSVVFDKILGHFNGDASELSGDKLGAARVGAEILEQIKTDKVIVFKKKRRHNYRRKNGHRQQMTVLRIGEISLDGKLTGAKPTKPKVAAPATSEEAAAKPPKKISAPKATGETAAKKPAAAKTVKPAAKSSGNAGVRAPGSTGGDSEA